MRDEEYLKLLHRVRSMTVEAVALLECGASFAPRPTTPAIVVPPAADAPTSQSAHRPTLRAPLR